MVVFAGPSGRIDVDALPEEILQRSGSVRIQPGVAEAALPMNLADSEQQAIEAALDRYDSLSEVARSLGIGRTTLWRKLRQYDIHRGPRGAQRRRQ